MMIEWQEFVQAVIALTGVILGIGLGVLWQHEPPWENKGKDDGEDE